MTPGTTTAADDLPWPNQGPRRIIHDLTVIIPTVGRPVLETCLRAIAGGTAWPQSLIVVDQGENPTVAAWLRCMTANGLQCVHLPSSERSPSSARNRAIERVVTPFAAALDDDCIPAADWLERMDDCLRRNPRSLITGRCLPAGDGLAPTIVTSTVPRIHTRPSLQFTSPLATGNLGFALDTARRIGTFDERLVESEDSDWAYRALRGGISIVFAPEVVVEHLHWRSDEQLASVSRAYARSQGAFYGKYLRKGHWAMAVRAAAFLLRHGKALLMGWVTHDRRRSANSYVKIKSLLSGLYAGLRGLGSR